MDVMKRFSSSKGGQGERKPDIDDRKERVA